MFIVGCGECATVTQTGGEKEVAEMKAQLEEAGKKVVGIDMVAANCQELDLKRILRKHKEATEEAEAFLVLSCGAGTQSVRAATDKHVVPGNDTLFLGNVQRSMDFVEKCSLCGDCVLDDYGAICPVTRCAKGLLNGPCGGTSHGKCEVDPEMDCALGAHPRAAQERGPRRQAYPHARAQGLEHHRPSGQAGRAQREAGG